MKIKCPKCRGENLDQGIDEKILCHDCSASSYIILVNEYIMTLRDIEQ